MFTVACNIEAEAHRGLDKSIRRLSQQIKLEPNNLELRLRRTHLMWLHDEFSRALRELLILRAQHPTHQLLSLQLATVYRSLRKFALAETILVNFVLCYPPRGLAFTLLARTLTQRKSIEQAIQVYQHAIRLSPHIDLFLERGALLERTGRWSEAIQQYKQGLKVVGQAVLLQVALFRTLQRTRRYKEAMLHVQRILRNASAKGEWWLRRAVLFDAMNQPKLASKDRNAALKEANRMLRFRANGWVMLRRARIYLSLRQKLKAIHELKQIRLQFPKLKEARVLLQRLEWKPQTR